jgi:MoxR-like ATPase
MTDQAAAGTQPNAPDGARADSAQATSAAIRDSFTSVRAEVGKAVVGQDGAVTGLIIALLAGGHVLLEGVPGVAKTLLVRTLSRALRLETKRVQFTPDLMPGDVTGSLVYDARSGEFDFRPGPVFTNLLLADEINRTPPKTQSALLEAMEERQVSVDGESRQLPVPFMVAATQNPIEYEGTYQLPEAQLDRFLLKLVLDVPERDSEIEVLTRSAAGFNPRDLGAAGVSPVLDAAGLAAAQAEVARVAANPDVLAYVVDLARATRQSPSVKLGVSPRGSTALLSATKAWAWLTGFDAITPDHVQEMVLPVWRHRIQLRPEAELEGVSADTILRSILQQVQVPI